MRDAARIAPGKPLAVALVAVLLTTCAGPRREAAPAAPSDPRTFAVLEHGALAVAVPRGWRVRTIELDPGTPASIRMDPPGGGALFLAPLYNPPPPAGSPGLETAAAFVDIARRGALASATDDVPVRPLRAESGAEIGYWFVATDREWVPPGPGQEKWRNMLRGAATIGSLLVSFTWFDDTPGPARDQVLTLVRGARHEGPAAAQAAPGEDRPEGGGAPYVLERGEEVTTVPLAVQEPGGDLTVLVNLPGFDVFAPREAPGGEGWLALAQHPSNGLVASVTIYPANRAADARACRDRKLARLRQGAPDLVEVSTAEAGEAARLGYVLTRLKGEEVRQVHAHAFLRRGERCVDVHASKAAPAPEDASLIEAILSTVRFASTL